MSAAPRDVITLKGMQFHACVGVYEHEHKFAQPIEIDLVVEITRPADGGIVDYSKLYDMVAAVMSAPHITYIETIADDVAARALTMDGVDVAHVAVRKPHVALAGPLAHAELRVTRSRG